MNTTARFSLVLSAAALCSLFALYGTAQQVGVTSTTTGEPRGTPPAQNERILRVGIDISANERVRTGTSDRAHLVFLDGSALTVGVDSDLVIDRYVYDPATQSGDLAMTATRGAFRFVGGSISKKKEIIVRTPSAELGVRGAISLWAVANTPQAGNTPPKISTTGTLLYGDKIEMRNALGTQAATRFGSQIFAALGFPPSPAFVLPPGSLQAYVKLFEQSQNTGNIIGPADRALIEGLLAGLNQRPLPPSDTDPFLANWLNYLQLLANQGVSTTNANRPGTRTQGNTSGPMGSGNTGGGNTGGPPCGNC